MHYIVINMCEKFYHDRLRNDRALGNRKFDNNRKCNNKNKNNVRSRSHWVGGPVSRINCVMGYREMPLPAVGGRPEFLPSGGSSYGRTGRPPPPPIDQNLGLVMAARLRHGGKFSSKSLTFGHFLYKNVQKAFSFRGALRPLTPHQGLCPWTRRGAPPPDPV